MYYIVSVHLVDFLAPYVTFYFEIMLAIVFSFFRPIPIKIIDMPTCNGFS